MKCPYDPNVITIWKKASPTYKRLDVETADGVPDVLHLYHNDETAITTNILRECIKEECGAYQNERCVRR